jgi:predicted Fe-Mo cluster-binding NifX family protein
MILAISSSGTDMNSTVDPRFGRCRCLVFFDTDTGNWEAVANSNIDAAGGAGIRTAQLVLDKGAAAVITGNVGPNAMNVLSGGGIPVYTGVSGTVESAVKLYQEGGLAAAGGPTAAPHSGMAGGSGGGGGTGMAGGMGMGGGGGMGRGRGGRGRGRGPW